MPRTANIKIHSQHSILDGEAFIFRIPLSGDVWQFRMYLRDEQKHFRKSLRTRDFETAQSRAKKLVLEVLGKKESGKKIFGVCLSELVEQYIAYRQREVAGGVITPGRLVTIKSQLNHFLEIKGRDTKASELDENSVYEFRLMRRERNPEVKDVTVRNETATINAMARWAYRSGLLHFDQFQFEPIRIGKGQIGRRDTFTMEEYDDLIRYMRKYVSKKTCPDEVERNERLLMRDYILISSNTGMRVGELRQLKWSDIEKIETKLDEEGLAAHLVTINVRAETSKVRYPRRIITRGGEYFTRIQNRTGDAESQSLVFKGVGEGGTIPPRVWERHWRNLMEGIGIDNYKERNVTWYSLRHFCITCRVKSGVNIIDIAKQAGTSVGHIENTYLKYGDDMMINAALKSFRLGNDGALRILDQ